MLDKYNPAEIESKHYQNWETQGYFQPDMDLTKPSFSIQLPPPNVTGTLHMGHAFNQTIMDGLTRYYRMKGCNTAWIPGTDHAGIATQIVVERQLAAQNVSRHDLGREKFLEKVWEWKEVSGGTITQQMRRVGCSADWTREYFTMDDVRAERMRQAAAEGFSTATDLADYLVKRGLPFRDAHELVAQAVREASDAGVDLAGLGRERLKALSPLVGDDVLETLTLEGSVNARNHIGGTAPAQVRAAIARHRARLASA